MKLLVLPEIQQHTEDQLGAGCRQWQGAADPCRRSPRPPAPGGELHRKIRGLPPLNLLNRQVWH